jgi:hypothetical protein
VVQKNEWHRIFDVENTKGNGEEKEWKGCCLAHSFIGEKSLPNKKKDRSKRYRLSSW